MSHEFSEREVIEVYRKEKLEQGIEIRLPITDKFYLRELNLVSIGYRARDSEFKEKCERIEQLTKQIRDHTQSLPVNEHEFPYSADKEAWKSMYICPTCGKDPHECGNEH